MQHHICINVCVCVYVRLCWCIMITITSQAEAKMLPHTHIHSQLQLSICRSVWRNSQQQITHSHTNIIQFILNRVPQHQHTFTTFCFDCLKLFDSCCVFFYSSKISYVSFYLIGFWYSHTPRFPYNKNIKWV